MVHPAYDLVPRGAGPGKGSGSDVHSRNLGDRVIWELEGTQSTRNGDSVSHTQRKKSPSAVSGTEGLGKGQRRELLQLRKRTAAQARAAAIAEFPVQPQGHGRVRDNDPLGVKVQTVAGPNVSCCSWVSSYGACSFIRTRTKSWMGNSRWPVAPCSPTKASCQVHP